MQPQLIMPGHNHRSWFFARAGGRGLGFRVWVGWG